MPAVNYKEWLDNEYSEWVKALQESTVHNFKKNNKVTRMLGEIDRNLFIDFNDKLFLKIDRIGDESIQAISGVCLRMIHYGRIILKNYPKRIVEIGAGVGQFYAILRALGYTGSYAIYDLPEVMDFQEMYLAEVERQTGLKCPLIGHDPYYSDWNDWFCVSFYALGEFDDETKMWYIDNVVNKSPHGLIVWNPHSGATKHVPILNCTVEDENPLTSPGNKLITW